MPKIYDNIENQLLRESFLRDDTYIIDTIDGLIAQHFGFTQEELDFIINYDIKYRMGKELDNGEEEE